VTDVTADQVLSQAFDHEEKGARDEAKAFLADLLADGPMPSKEVLKNARDAGVAERTLRRAAQDLGVQKSKTAMEGGWLWKLASKVAKPAGGVHSKVVSIFGPGGRLRCPRCAGEGCNWCQPAGMPS
jgi:hypothetical protein